MLSRQRELHPDKFANSGEEMVELARELSGRVNKAYETLGDPLKRAEYIVNSASSNHARELGVRGSG
jgi:molecular chaperone HscB